MLRSALLALLMIFVLPTVSISDDLANQPGTAETQKVVASQLIEPSFSPLIRKAYYPGCRRDCTVCRNYCYSTYRLNCYAAHCRNSFTLCMRDCWNNHCRGC